jgi:hypothetical protein
MKLKLAVLVMLAGLAIIACKKEEKQPSTPTNTGGGGGGGGNNQPQVSNATAFSGIFSASTNTYYSASFQYIGSNAYAYFSNMPQPFINSSSAVTVSSVYLNNDPLVYDPTSKYYITTNTVNLTSETWTVNGANGIGTFTFANTNALTPKANNLSTLPGTISLSSGFTLNITGVANITGAQLIVYDGSAIYSRTVNVGTNNINVTPTDLSGLTTSTAGIIGIVMENKKAYIFSGKDYQFNREAQYNRELVIIP